ncbi:hypothetical protein H6G06_21010 [Anabaena sphaerica FACHB-251]|uniref:Uncharacterized protein n=1 Tax=Anabaena sphaerica FACHB-251 TaxID=2692883 RepID=A0A926WM13_9NOST|nr:hypothetical protein [Anabaena sphaerica]MBD2295886.1 hypothetical protein [Anabaena sphaerica FACHB-251]
MKAKFPATLTIIAAFLSLNSAVYAQSMAQPQPGSFTLKGDSLVNINDRNAKNDFRKFFEQISQNQAQENTISEELPLSESITIPYTPIFLQPAYQNLNENDGLQLQLDLSDGN